MDALSQTLRGAHIAARVLARECRVKATTRHRWRILTFLGASLLDMSRTRQSASAKLKAGQHSYITNMASCPHTQYLARLVEINNLEIDAMSPAFTDKLPQSLIILVLDYLRLGTSMIESIIAGRHKAPLPSAGPGAELWLRLEADNITATRTGTPFSIRHLEPAEERGRYGPVLHIVTFLEMIDIWRWVVNSDLAMERTIDAVFERGDYHPRAPRCGSALAQLRESIYNEAAGYL